MSIFGQVTKSISEATKIPTPWDGSTVSSKFFPKINISPSRWNQLFPYRLLVVDVTDGNKIINGPDTGTSVTFGSAGDASIFFEVEKSGWIFNLPITPQQLSMVDQFAINTTATLRGILEEHNGVKFKMISASGTLGVWPLRDSVDRGPESTSFIQTLFGGSIAAGSALLATANSIKSLATGNHPKSKPDPFTPDLNDTGYYQAMYLQQFLEQYAEAKKDPKNAGWRLVFDIPKQNTSYVVTPQQYTWSQNANRPLNIDFAIQFKAWRRIDLKEGSFASESQTAFSLDPNVLQKITNSLRLARRAASQAQNLFKAFGADLASPLEYLRQTSLLVKDLAGVVVTAIDLPAQVVNAYGDEINSFLATFDPNVAGGATGSNSAIAQAAKNFKTGFKYEEGIGRRMALNGQLGTDAANQVKLNPSNGVITDPTNNFDVLDAISVGDLKLSSAKQAKVDEIIADARDITVDTLKKYRASVLDLATQLSNGFGASDPYFAKVYGKPDPKVRSQPMTLTEFDLLKSLYDAVQAYDLLTATTQLDDQNKETNMDYVAGLANQSSVPFTTTTSKVLAPVPYGLTVEGIAARYLGDPQRWLEIVTLNGLRVPYIDESGFKLTLLSNASGRYVTVGTSDNLYVGQKVSIVAAGQTTIRKTLLDIKRLSDSSFLLTLDGLDLPSGYTTANSSYLQAYLPGTVNSQQKIFIPSDLPVPNDPNIIPPPATTSDPLTGVSKVDWLLDEYGDVATDKFGDFRYSYGITNIIQALKTKIGTQKGSMLLHPTFGLGIQPGVSNADFKAQDIYNSLSKMIEQDRRFQKIEKLQISLDGPSLTISMAVSIAGQSGVFPVSFTLN